MEIIGVILFIVFAALAAMAIWTLALLAGEERWGLFVAAIPFWFLLGPWLLYQRRPHPEKEDCLRLMVYGLVLSGSLFLPAWVTGIALFIFLAAELQMIVYKTSGPRLYPAPPRKIRRAGLLEEEV